MFGFLSAKCDSCNAFNIDEIDPVDPEHVTCKGCGAKLIPFTAPGTYLKFRMSRSGVSKSKGLLSNSVISYHPQRSHNGALVRHERTVDKKNDHYFERVTLLDSDTVIHLTDEPLSEHQGHGSAKRQSSRQQ